MRSAQQMRIAAPLVHTRSSARARLPNVLINGKAVLRIGDPGSHKVCCGSNSWIIAEGSSSVSVNDLPVARLGDSTLHCGGRGVLIQGSSNVNVGGGSVGLNVTLGQLVGGMLNTTLGNSSMSVEEMARKNALLMLDNAQISLMRWNESDQAQFKEWFGTTDETARRAMLDRIDRSRPILQEAP
ncbi:MAG: PAAR domain-containing protein, partial [Deltaproteobacteria bacterium]|nr:PAAR domain-containing protein [Deltaproteobacteria bacterium]